MTTNERPAAGGYRAASQQVSETETSVAAVAITARPQYSYRVTFRRRGWLPTTESVRRFETYAGAYRFVERLNRDRHGRGLTHAAWRIDRRAVSPWESFDVSGGLS